MTRKLYSAAIAVGMTYFAMIFGSANAIAADLKLLASANASLRSALTELAPEFERSTGHGVIMDFASAIPLKRRIDGGETFDIVIATGVVDDLIKEGKITANTRTVIARTGLGIGVHKGAPKAPSANK